MTIDNKIKCFLQEVKKHFISINEKYAEYELIHIEENLQEFNIIENFEVFDNFMDFIKNHKIDLNLLENSDLRDLIEMYVLNPKYNFLDNLSKEFLPEFHKFIKHYYMFKIINPLIKIVE